MRHLNDYVRLSVIIRKLKRSGGLHRAAFLAGFDAVRGQSFLSPTAVQTANGLESDAVWTGVGRRLDWSRMPSGLAPTDDVRGGSCRERAAG